MMEYEYEKYLNKIIASKSFGNSPTYSNLLRYLIQCTRANAIPKETEIAAQIFGKKDFDPSQSTLIRVNIYNLRKKLKTYYLNEGAKDQMVLRIPKGGYEVKFGRKESAVPANKKEVLQKLLPAALILLVASLFLNGFLFSKTNDHSPLHNSALWKDIFDSDRNIMLLVGDLYLYEEIDTINETQKTIRNPLVNTKEDLEALHNNANATGILYEPLPYSLLIRNSTSWVKDLSKVLNGENKNFSVRMASRFNAKELPDNDILVVGMAKTLGIFRDYINRSSIKYDVESRGFLFNEKDFFAPSGDPENHHTDYALMLKVPGPNGNNIYIFAGIWDTGASQSFKNFTDVKLVKALERKMIRELGDTPEYFEVFFKVSGVDRMELSSEIMHLAELKLN